MNDLILTRTAPPHRAIEVEQEGPVLHVRLNPERGDDVLDVTGLDALIALLDGLHERPDVRVLVLSSLGEDFCLGADRNEYQEALAADPTGGALRRIADKAHRLCQALEGTHAITVARLHGRVVGAGLALASYCDLRAGADTCRFRMPEVGVGLPPAWGGAMGRLIAEAGAARIREYMLTCEVFDAATAHRLGLLHKVAPLDQLDHAVAGWTRPLVRRSPEALVLTKRMLNGYARADRTADVSLLDSHLLTAQLNQPRSS
ncbi:MULTISPECIES: enoyl-CoA hydratase/isomerase family protein [unclassified Streptomyces]|uniref:enoyl-CoA hydratase/isomerase family protein n=1 Tax=Streptomyces TaxID=1883 RepID=UPI0001C1A36C|nr:MULTISPECIES: enoyl-CoA hydratase/isomerase family protein [unclassified Streptomyces]AEN10622.1 Enoyl-CoA hydratase/isomerase [Streptomyces sp. SirexAA-E]MYR68901.1 enoyl-CoA hydratase/isomerase family protein [Streptomyces sp. SID4939]MYS02925.1 enoyl-CoA hydratase/isomerase family protein [Streptomyces sp. SID4940]MYT62188.1 enoyl-CoA hydratase/isomerase family protein [Streptomyces sp. SID8357]MYT84016.1 enoyl-CoA hydratase/isomerase family protein [Streptomyces sp. SID8360]